MLSLSSQAQKDQKDQETEKEKEPEKEPEKVPEKVNEGVYNLDLLYDYEHIRYIFVMC